LVIDFGVESLYAFAATCREPVEKVSMKSLTGVPQTSRHL
jgi:hypothetical protein